MNKEEFRYVKLGDLYVKEFKMATVMVDEGYWKVRREISLTNDLKSAIPIEKTEAQGLMKLLGSNTILIERPGGKNEM